VDEKVCPNVDPVKLERAKAMMSSNLLNKYMGTWSTQDEEELLAKPFKGNNGTAYVQGVLKYDYYTNNTYVILNLDQYDGKYRDRVSNLIIGINLKNFVLGDNSIKLEETNVTVRKYFINLFTRNEDGH